MENKIINLNNLPNNLTNLRCYNNKLISENLNFWKGIKKLRNIYFKLKFSNRIIKYYLNLIKKHKLDLHNELLYSSNLIFYKQNISLITKTNMKE